MKANTKTAPEVDKLSRPPARRLSISGLATAIPQYAGNLAAVARSFGVTRAAVWQYVQSHPELMPVLKDARETRVDNAESSLDRAVLAGEGWAVTLILKTLGRDRGYVDRQEVHIDGAVASVTEVIVRTREEAAAVLALMAPANEPHPALPQAG